MTSHDDDVDPLETYMLRCRAAVEEGETAFETFQRTGKLPINPYGSADERAADWTDGFISKRWEAEGKPRLSMQEEDAAYAEGKAARRDEQKTDIATDPPHDRYSLVDVLASNRHEMWLTGYFDGCTTTFEVLGTPTATTLEREHADGSVTYSMPAPGQQP